MSDGKDVITEDFSFAEWLEFEYLEVGKFTVDVHQAAIHIQVFNLWILDKHPKYAEMPESDEYVIVFHNVSKSQRHVAEYEKDKEPKSLSSQIPTVYEDEFGATSSENTKSYYLGGVLREPSAWIGWDIQATDYEIKLPI